MALVLADRVRETTTVTGTGTATLLGAVSGYQSFSAVGNANTTYYVIANQSATEWEVGIGTYTSSGTTLSRDTVLSSSNSGSLVNFSAGTKDVFVDYPAGKAVYENAAGNVDGYPITGGTIDNTTIGATTPSTGVFTTLTAQTEVLKGTGNNLFLYSQDFSNANWNKANSSISGTLFTAPDATTTANSLIESSATGLHYVQQFSPTLVSGNTYTISVYLKAGTRTWGYIGLPSGVFGATSAYFNLSTGAVGTVVGGTAAITSVGSGWYRCSITKAATAGAGGNILIATATADNTVSYVGDGTSNILVWGAQLEIGTSAFNYIPTTTTAVYGTPILSFSGVASIGLQSDGSLYHQPAGTGAVQAQATTSSATGGNARGANAVDWQTVRTGAAQVGSGSGSVVGGGAQNIASSAYATVTGGLANSVTAFASFIGAGQSNTSSGGRSAVVTGRGNTAAGELNFIGGGYVNSGTSASAVTTQSGTMNGTTAVTLSGSNANIKVGQFVTGTSIASETYVAAISGTSLTLSQAASGSSTSTLSFYTPHGVVVGGGNNQATGSYSFIGGGGDAGTAANRNVASGDWSFVGGGIANQATGLGSVICGGGWFSAGSSFAQSASGVGAGVLSGSGNYASGDRSAVLTGYNNGATTVSALVGGGFQSVATGQYSTALNGHQVTTRGIYGSLIYGGRSGFGLGGGQAGNLVLTKQTTDATPTVLVSDIGGAGTTNQVILPNNSAYYFKGSVIANVTGAANGAAWSFEGAIMRGANAASTVLMGTPAINRVAATAGATAWAIAITADTTNGGLAVTVTGAASTTIRWVCKAETTEVTF